MTAFVTSSIFSNRASPRASSTTTRRTAFTTSSTSLKSSFTRNVPLRIRKPSRANTPRCTVSNDTVQHGHDCKIVIDGHQIAYDYFPATSSNSPTIVYLPSFFYSRWRQAKANALEIFAKRKGQAILVEEYLGIGRSEGDFIKEGTISRWVSDTVHLIENVVGDSPVVLVGAGIGGWIMLHVAMQCKNVVGLVGMNPSVDFTEDLMLPKLSQEQKDLLQTEGYLDMTWGYRSYAIGKALVEDAKKWLVLHHGEGSLDINCPVRLLQGLSDEEIPPTRILGLVDALKSDDCVVSFIKYGDHYLETDEDMHRMWDAVCEVSEKYFEYDLTSPSSG